MPRDKFLGALRCHLVLHVTQLLRLNCMKLGLLFVPFDLKSDLLDLFDLFVPSDLFDLLELLPRQLSFPFHLIQFEALLLDALV